MSLAHRFSHIANLIGHPSRALMLDALLGAECLPAGALADSAGITAQTASKHLQLLQEGGLVTSVQEGKYRYFRIADSGVHAILQQLALTSLQQPPANSAALPNLHAFRRCHNHMAGRLGVRIAQALVARQWLQADAAGEDFVLTESGAAWLQRQDIDVQQARVAGCLDWTERKPHIAGWLGECLLDKFVAEQYVRASMLEPRVLQLTERGGIYLAAELGLAVS